MNDFSSKLIKWYLANKRDLPWRNTTNPYHIWVSEIMLQQTQAATVIPYYLRFIETLPSIEDLAKVDLDLLYKLWEGLGYYSRARNLKNAAMTIMDKHQGVLPNTYDDLIKLKGIGRYTAGAILSLAFHLPYSATDGNVIRTLSRYYGIKEDTRLEKTKTIIDGLNQKNISIIDPHNYTQAMIEMGATLCTKSKPKCEICPINEHCYAYLNNKQSELPFTSKLKQKKEIQWITVILRNEAGDYLLQKQETNLLNGLYLYPQFEAESINYVEDIFNELGATLFINEDIGSYTHVFSHLKWDMRVYHATTSSNLDYTVVKPSNFDLYPMATAHKQIKKD
jgi:A/G-specific adenine glycosylase